MHIMYCMQDLDEGRLEAPAVRPDAGPLGANGEGTDYQENDNDYIAEVDSKEAQRVWAKVRYRDVLPHARYRVVQQAEPAACGAACRYGRCLTPTCARRQILRLLWSLWTALVWGRTHTPCPLLGFDAHNNNQH